MWLAMLEDSWMTLAVWWAVWSLSDAYLLRYSPWSEIAVLAVCLLVWGAPAAYRRIVAGVRNMYQKRLVPVLEGI